MSRRSIFAAALLALTAAPALAEVKSAAPGGFEVGGTVSIDASPARVWTVLTAPDAWWSRDHRWFKDSTLSLDLAPGGCWCERAADGRVSRHLETALVEPQSKLVLRGGLGPLQGQGASGGLTFTIKAVGESSTLTWSYIVGGYTPGGLEAWAAPVDGVLSAQIASLKTRAEIPD
ncbi:MULTISPECIES: SRPBCC family protein [unclassified Brevundimonas]|uniref:SRPBCC family protein n=1 Tax=unclassified Brevundimonas TaxID=2622653 RepID=UPI000CFD3868|nr:MULTISPECIES: SRPBCC family protein [unclassified Brevundimonas]PRA31168.1 ATPase [Brevundimonas sp. MYb27]PQZ81346.1 ATPase [Brevundimonas sp. MYb31]PRB12664.1 ATPase [Brevundimonas sp. MYb52]PRB33497.1 ATPase [Brevundimonas sp. MYb46]PRB51249.1 ATPase [Brevundimonas sp. MYb33]